MNKDKIRLPKDDLVRGITGVPIHFLPDESRDGSVSGTPTLHGHFAVFNTWSEINSLYEGHFMERFAPGAFKKTIAERGPTGTNQVRCLFQHGYDYVVGDKPLGPFEDLSEDEQGVYYRVPLLRTSYNADIIPGLEAGVYGASFRFRVMREDIEDSPKPSADNPRGLPERTVKEVQLMEGGPVTFGAYKEATAGLRMRSLTDEVLVERLARDPERLRELVADRAARMDSEDAGCLAQMVALASNYIAEQDESDDAANVPAMEAIQQQLIDLLNVEASEVEPDEPEDESLSSAPSDGSTDSESRTVVPDEEPVTKTTPRRVPDYLRRPTAPSWQL